MLQNYKKDFKPYFTGLRQDNNKLKEFFNTDSFILYNSTKIIFYLFVIA